MFKTQKVRKLIQETAPIQWNLKISTSAKTFPHRSEIPSKFARKMIKNLGKLIDLKIRKGVLKQLKRVFGAIKITSYGLC